MAAHETEVAEQATRLELAEGEKFQMTNEMANLREKLAKAEKRIAELEAANVDLDTAGSLNKKNCSIASRTGLKRISLTTLKVQLNTMKR